MIQVIHRAIDAVEAWLYRRRYEAHVRARARRERAAAASWFVVLAAVSLTACGGAERHARTALEVAARAVVATDEVTDRVYHDRAIVELDAAIAAHPTDADAARADYRERMRTLDAVEAALRASASSVRAAEATLDAPGADDLLGTLGCVAVAIGRLVEALGAAGLDPPEKLADALDVVLGVVPATCTGGSP